MRVVIVTGRAPHHRRFCAMLARAFDVVGVLHPAQLSSVSGRARRFLRHARANGWTLAALNLAGKLAVSATRAAPVSREADAVRRAYDEIPQALVHADCDVADPWTHALLRNLEPDVTVCLGGPIYPPNFIAASPLTFNYHSGISPIYNGASSIEFAFANGHPQLCGGTLMTMSPVVDGGRILGHYLPAVEPGDSPASLFDKTVAGAPLMVARLLQRIAQGTPHLTSLSQPPPLFFTRAIQLGCYQTAMIDYHLRRDLAARHQRPERIVEYWKAADEACASALMTATLDGLVWGMRAIERPLAEHS